MEPQTPQQQDTMVGCVHIPPVVFSQALLAGTLSGARHTSANSARRRLCGPTLLGSPARRGHSPGMSAIFGEAKANLASRSVPAMKVASPMPAMRQLPLRPKSASVLNNSALRRALTTNAEQFDTGPLYPIIPPELLLDRKDEASHPMLPAEGLENNKQVYEAGVLSPGTLYSNIRQARTARLSPEPGSPQHSYFDRPPTITHAQIVPMNEIQTAAGPQDDLSSSSASWTGDSQFYMPQQRPMMLPLQERKSSVPQWLAELPAKPDDFEPASSSDVEMEEDDATLPLSPSVEIERGSMRRKMRENKRRRSFGDDDVYPE